MKCSWSLECYQTIMAVVTSKTIVKYWKLFFFFTRFFYSYDAFVLVRNVKNNYSCSYVENHCNSTRYDLFFRDFFYLTWRIDACRNVENYCKILKLFFFFHAFFNSYYVFVLVWNVTNNYCCSYVENRCNSTRYDPFFSWSFFSPSMTY